MFSVGKNSVKLSDSGINVAEHSGHLNWAVVSKNAKIFYKHFLTDRKLKLCEIAEELKISEGSVFIILYKHLSVRKQCSMWLLRLLKADQKQK